MTSLLRSSALLAELGLAHGFSTAAAGDVRAIGAQAILLAAAGWRGPLATCRQIHGTAILWPDGGGADAREADALAAAPGLAVGIFTADCVPILLVDPGAGLCAAVHAGWRGTLAQIAQVAVRALCDAGARPAALRAALGPRVGPCCYEVDADLAARFRDRFGPEVLDSGPGGALGRRLDLGAANHRLLEEAGLPPSQIELLAGCTSCSWEGSAPAFYSYRRDRDLAGRQLSFIGLHGGGALSRAR